MIFENFQIALVLLGFKHVIPSTNSKLKQNIFSFVIQQKNEMQDREIIKILWSFAFFVHPPKWSNFTKTMKIFSIYLIFSTWFWNYRQSSIEKRGTRRCIKHFVLDAGIENLDFPSTYKFFLSLMNWLVLIKSL